MIRERGRGQKINKLIADAKKKKTKGGKGKT